MLRFVFLSVLFLACSDEINKPSVQLKNGLDSMTVLHDSMEIDKTNLVSAEIKITWSGEYCNGAYPSDEMLAEARAVHPLEMFEVIFKSDSESYSIRTDHRGHLQAQLLPGNYELFLSDANDMEGAPFDLGCSKYYDRSWGELQVQDQKLSYKMHIYFPCDLCDENAYRRP